MCIIYQSWSLFSDQIASILELEVFLIYNKPLNIIMILIPSVYRLRGFGSFLQYSVKTTAK